MPLPTHARALGTEQKRRYGLRLATHSSRTHVPGGEVNRLSCMWTNDPSRQAVAFLHRYCATGLDVRTFRRPQKHSTSNAA